MKFVEAFSRLGYELAAPRQDWTAEKCDGVCISLWLKETGMRDGMPWMDTRLHADPLEKWQHKPGNRKRIRHLRRAIEEFGGRVDVVIVSGDPGVSYGTAQPWVSEVSRAGPSGKTLVSTRRQGISKWRFTVKFPCRALSKQTRKWFVCPLEPRKAQFGDHLRLKRKEI